MSNEPTQFEPWTLPTVVHRHDDPTLMFMQAPDRPLVIECDHDTRRTYVNAIARLNAPATTNACRGPRAHPEQSDMLGIRKTPAPGGAVQNHEANGGQWPDEWSTVSVAQNVSRALGNSSGWRHVCS